MEPDEYPTREIASKLPLNEQDKCIAELGEAVSLLSDRLVSVLTPIPSDSVKAEGIDRDSPVCSPLADTLADNNSRIRRITNKINYLLDRLEV